MREDSFWYFLNEKEQMGTRIDMLFDLLAKDYNTNAKNTISSDQNYFPFLVFFATLKNSKGCETEFVDTLWNDVEKLYSEFRDWYNDLNKYHIIGYLIATGTTIAEIFSLTSGKRKSAVAADLLAKAKVKYDDLGTLSLDTTAHKKRIRQLLLLFNEKFTVKNEANNLLFVSQSDDPISETVRFLSK